jgi:O-methyltransferase
MTLLSYITQAGSTQQQVLQKFVDLALKYEGDMAELGVYQGGTAKLIKKIMGKSDKVLHLFDTFCGMPKSNYPLLDKYNSMGSFGNTSLSLVKQVVGTENIIYYPGIFPETARGLEAKQFCLVHVDCDLYQSHKDCLEFFYPRIISGFMVFDDYNHPQCLGATTAVNEFLETHKDTVDFVVSSTSGAVMYIGEARQNE